MPYMLAYIGVVLGVNVGKHIWHTWSVWVFSTHSSPRFLLVTSDADPAVDQQGLWESKWISEPRCNGLVVSSCFGLLQRRNYSSVVSFGGLE